MMRALVAIVILIIGGALGYGWHEVSPRVLGSQPFCGPMYPGMFHTISEREFFPAGLDIRQHPEFIADGRMEHFDWLHEPNDPGVRELRLWKTEDLLIELGEPSLWQLTQAGATAVRYYQLGSFGNVFSVRFMFNDEVATVHYHYVWLDDDNSIDWHGQGQYELDRVKSAQAREFFFMPMDAYSSEIVWNQCADLIDYPNIVLTTEPDGDGFVVMADGYSAHLELVEGGRYLNVSQGTPPGRSWLGAVGETARRFIPDSALEEVDGDRPNDELEQ